MSSATARSPSPISRSDDRRPLALAARHPLRLARDADRCGASRTASGSGAGSGWPWRKRSASSGSPSRRTRWPRCAPTSTTSTWPPPAAYERRFRHDVMAHVHAFGEQAPAARPYLHLGATSAFVTDNADLIVMRDGLRLLLGRLIAVLVGARGIRPPHRGHPLPRLHPLPAGAAHHRRQARDALDAGLRARRRGDLSTGSQTLRFRGCKGTTGTQASFLELFDGDHGKVRELERRVTGQARLRRRSSRSPARPIRARSTAWCSTR